MSEIFLVVSVEGMLLASSGERSGINIPQCTGQAPPIMNYPAPNVNGAKAENPGLGKGSVYFFFSIFL